jgi:ribosomal 30S subunit maturation factor RimM
MLFEALQQAAVVTGDFDYQVIRTQVQKFDNRPGILDVVSCYGIRGAGNVDVVTEQDLRINNVQELYQRAGLTEVQVQREAQLAACLIWRLEK